MKAFALALLLLSANLHAADGALSSLRFDGSTEESTKQSNTEIMSHLSNQEKADYLAALIRIQSHDLETRRVSDPSANASPLGPKINGMTYQEILDFAKKFPDNVKVIHAP